MLILHSSNEELAKHYRISGVNGSHMRLVSLKGTGRSGILGQGSVLAITSSLGGQVPWFEVTGFSQNCLVRLHLRLHQTPASSVNEFQRIADSLSGISSNFTAITRIVTFVTTKLIPGFALEGFEWFGRKRRASTSAVTGQLPSGRKGGRS